MIRKKAFLLFVIIANAVFIQAQEPCGTMPYHDILELKYPGLQKSMHASFSMPDTNQAEWLNGSELMIPVVVHIVYNTSAQNISNQQVYSQITVLNEDFNRENTDSVNTRKIFDSVAGYPNIRFCLATVDPDGNSTSGITRTQTSVNKFTLDDKVKRTVDGGKDPWPRDKYMNLWVCNLGGSILGYASFPTDPPEEDGVVVHFENFGRGGSSLPPFNNGRTATHETGHWLGLYHTWGDGAGDGCLVDDFMDDTPLSEREHYNCPTQTPNTCIDTSMGPDLPDQYENYMEYVNDNCMNLFTKEQAIHMRLVLNSFRNKLKFSNGCGIAGISKPVVFEKVRVLPNPAFDKIRLDGLSAFTAQSIQVFNANGQNIITLFDLPEWIDITDLHSGLFFIQVNFESGYLIRKFIKP
jgi:pregnancy-associated plasma protein-A/type IX secretion system substrate protein